MTVKEMLARYNEIIKYYGFLNPKDIDLDGKDALIFDLCQMSADLRQGPMLTKREFLNKVLCIVFRKKIADINIEHYTDWRKLAVCLHIGHMLEREKISIPQLFSTYRRVLTELKTTAYAENDEVVVVEST